ncbi:MAG: hypothetical protein R3D34_14885 [Nitratireductor sp.]
MDEAESIAGRISTALATALADRNLPVAAGAAGQFLPGAGEQDFGSVGVIDMQAGVARLWQCAGEG